ncbi:tryptophan halogenase family protein [Sphingomonas morindae]|uniref:Tryptophan 7-halogenase n=1 Tax=Sphingomonas morindae TaxID=1541170 RepID=A0ABY4XCU0_9SPHN|nr:tryptophan halogenase family protein [Sphingomonas morindae]USI74777.1 tryptophan 7-halogenase [Sphingomonas morindae]
MAGDRIHSLVILGGGTAGWMTAAALARTLPPGLEITLVESDAIGTIGVGEATIPTIHWFNQLAGIDEAEFMAATGATYKLGIEFSGWTGDGSRYFHPFGTFGPPQDGVMFLHRLIRARLAGEAIDPEAYSLTAQAARAGRFAKPVADPRSPLATLGYAYHFDAGRYAAFLRARAEAAGVRRIEALVEGAERDPASGAVAALATSAGRIAGDLFIDCSGLRGLLIGETLGIGYEDWSAWLPCDRAWAVPTAAETEPRPYTRATAAEAGWRWRIPLQHRTGNGYVYSSRFQSDAAARAALLGALDAPVLAEPRLIRFRPGRRARAWSANVVAIGLAAGFLEPLESTSIHLIQSGIAKLLALFPPGGGSALLAEQYNRLMAREMEEIRDILILHYAMTSGRPEPMWRERQTMTLPDSLAWRLDHFRETGRIVLASEELFRDASWFAILDGQGVRARDHSPMIEGESVAALTARLAAVREATAAACARLPRLAPPGGAARG